ncbi:hypothetical protein [Kineosporia sp. A_224]|uniref:hypothetical protein n=1 Tax=Kineosporia sp. A_224 TaxID=1962180 RepID=UPI000B4AF301|nr:hypothetical protein [Kineosporia sp. A_224]
MNDDDLRLLVRDSLSERAEDLPAATPSWDRVRGGLVGVRRERRRRQALAAGALALLVAVGVVGVQSSSLTALRRADPANPDGLRVAGDPAFGRTTVGSLGRDDAFLAGVRREVLARGTFVVETLQPGTGAGDLTVAFAGDVGDVRLVLVEAPTRSGPDGDIDTFLWFSAPRGASATAVVAGEVSSEAAGATTQIWRPAPGGPATAGGTGAYVVLSRIPGSVVRTATGPTYDAGGRQPWSVRTVPAASDHHWEVAVPWSDRFVSPMWTSGPEGTSWSALDPPFTDGTGTGLLDGAEPALHSDRPARDAAIESAFAAAQTASGVPVARSTRRLLWTGSAGVFSTSVVAVTVPGGAHVVTAVREQLEGDNVLPVSRSTVVLPAGPLDRVAMAWALGPPDEDGTTGLAALGPVGATTMTVTDDRGRTSSETLIYEYADASVVNPVTVEFTDLTGATLARVPVTALEAGVAPPTG